MNPNIRNCHRIEFWVTKQFIFFKSVKADFPRSIFILIFKRAEVKISFVFLCVNLF